MNNNAAIMLVSQSQLQEAESKQAALTSAESLNKFAEFLRSEQLTEKTIKQYHSSINAFFSWCFDQGIKPWLAEYQHVKAYRNYIQDTRKLALSSINLRLVAINRFFQALQDSKIRVDNPATGVHKKKDNTARGERQKNLTKGQLDAVMKLASQSSAKTKDRNMAIIMLMGYAGLRCNEVCNVKLADVNLLKKSVLIHRKRGKEQTIFLGEKRFAYLWPLIQKAQTTQSEYLFCNESFRPSKTTTHLSPRGLIQIVDSFLCKLGLKEKRKSSHCLRHTYARTALVNGVSKEDLKELLGHSDIRTVEIYIAQMRKESVLDKVMDNILPRLN